MQLRQWNSGKCAVEGSENQGKVDVFHRTDLVICEQLRPYNVNVNAISPGSVASGRVATHTRSGLCACTARVQHIVCVVCVCFRGWASSARTSTDHHNAVDDDD